MEMEETGLVLLWLDMIKSTVSTIYIRGRVQPGYLIIIIHTLLQGV